jgi:acyl carrier protein
MGETEIYTRLADVFESIFDDQSIELAPTLSAKDVDGWDSLTNIRLMLTVEKTFKLKFSASDIAKLENVGDLVTLIKTRV